MAKESSHQLNNSQIIDSREYSKYQKNRDKQEKLTKPAYLDMSNISGSFIGPASEVAVEQMFQGNLVAQQLAQQNRNP